jgi:methyltransferase (TIGR00027 family)
MRALHTRTDPKPLLDDPWGDRLVPESIRATIPDEALLRSPAFANVILRSRYTEDALEVAVRGGVQQYVLIGAGFDSFVLRRPDFARNLRIFEIDHPATQQLKLQRIAECGLHLPPSVHFIAADLSQQSVAAVLSHSAYDPGALSFFSWLGVTMYLTREANLATFRSVASCAPAGSFLAFTYIESSVLQTQSAAFQELQARVSAMGEPFLSGFDPGLIGGELRACGLELVEDLSVTVPHMSHSPDARLSYDPLMQETTAAVELDENARYRRTIRAAEELFKKVGFRAVTMEMVAREANVAKATLYSHFKNKDELYIAVSARMARIIMGAFNDALTKGGSPLDERLTEAVISKHRLVYSLVRGSPHSSELFSYTHNLAGHIWTEMDAAIVAAMRIAIATDPKLAPGADQLSRALYFGTSPLAMRCESLNDIESELRAFTAIHLAGARALTPA